MRTRRVSLQSVRYLVLLGHLAFSMSCGETPSAPDAWVPVRYAGYVAIGPDWLDAYIHAEGQGCVCDDSTPPPLGECRYWDDVGDGCTGCLGELCHVFIRLSSGNYDSDIIGTSRAQVGDHGTLPGDDLTLLVSGCIGDLQLVLPVPDVPAVVVNAPVAGDASTTEVSWTPSDSSWEAMISAGRPNNSVECLVQDTGATIAPKHIDTMDYVTVNRREFVGIEETATSHISVYNDQRGDWGTPPF